jgi:hypothetical protein
MKADTDLQIDCKKLGKSRQCSRVQEKQESGVGEGGGGGKYLPLGALELGAELREYLVKQAQSAREPFARNQRQRIPANNFNTFQPK